MEMGHHQRFLGKTPLSPESALAASIFDQFVSAQTFKAILATFRHLCDTLKLKPSSFSNFYPKLKAKLPSWKAQALWAKFDKRASHKCYNRGKTCANTRVLIIGGGPCGLRAAIEAQLLGAKVVVIEKRDRFSRNNVLHLWPFVIHDLRALGSKKFFGKFCAGSIDHISIRQLQCILLKVCLLLGVEVHESVTFEKLVEPPIDQSDERIGWRAQVSPPDHPVSQYEFDVLIGADGKRNTLQGFKRKEFRGKLAIAITANFINRHTELDAQVEEISGVAFIFNQKFFQEMREQVGIDLENIVYYKDDTHYFVMTAKKQSLIEKGVILNDYSDTARLLAPNNVDREALMDYAREAADFSTNYQLPSPEFAVNHYGQADVAMFDFTSMYAAENACKILERRGHRLLMGLVGDSLLEPFWPTGSGCARGFLSSLDSGWMIRSWASGTMSPLQVLAQRESIYRLLAQTTPENLTKDYSEYSLNPQSRYPNLNQEAVRPMQVLSLYDSDKPIKEEFDVISEIPKKKQKRSSVIHPDTLLHWCQKQVALYDNVQIENMNSSWKSGLALCAIIHRYRPDLIEFNSLKIEDVAKNNDLAFEICDREFGISQVLNGQEMAECEIPDELTIVSYLSQLYDVFRGEIPHVARPTIPRSPSDEIVPATSSDKWTSSGGRLLARISQRLANRKVRPAPERLSGGASQEPSERMPKKRRQLDRERELFITSRENKRVDLLPISLPGEGKAVPFSDRVKTLESLLSGESNKPEYDRSQMRRGSLDLDLRSTSLNRLQNDHHSNVKVGRLERGDWNVKMLEERLKERQLPKKTIEGVPKWNRECFEDKLKSLDYKARGTEDEKEKFSDFDQRLRQLDRKLKEGSVLETGQRGSNKVSVMAEQLAAVLEPKQEHPPLTQTNAKPNVAASGGSEKCHFCSRRVYLMERLSAQGKFFHRGCFKCEYCGTSLRLGSYGYAADGNFGGRFLCMQHFGMPLNFPKKQFVRGVVKTVKPPREGQVQRLTVVDSAEQMRGATPERAEFENSIVVDQATEDETLSEMDEDEWTDRNFGTSATEMESTSDDESDLSSEENSEDEDALEEALEQSIKDETRWLTDTWKRKLLQESGDRSLLEETDEDYVESDDEYSYEVYENEGAASGSELWTPSPDGKADEGKPLKLFESDVEILSPTASSAVAEDIFSTSDGLSVSESSSDEDYEEEEEEEEDGEEKRNAIHEIPSIIIDEFATSQQEEMTSLLEQESPGEPIQIEAQLITQSDEEALTPVDYDVTLYKESSEEFTPEPDTASSENAIETVLLQIETPECNICTETIEEKIDEKEESKDIIFRKGGLAALRRDMEIKSVIEPLEKPDDKREEVTSLETANSLPNLTEPEIESQPKKEEEIRVSRTLKLKERYLLGETPSQEKINKDQPNKSSTPKLEPVVKNFLEMITEKQKMLTPSPPSSSGFSTYLFNRYQPQSPPKIEFGSSPISSYLEQSKPEVKIETIEKVADIETEATDTHENQIEKPESIEETKISEELPDSPEEGFEVDDKYVTIRRKKKQKPEAERNIDDFAVQHQISDTQPEKIQKTPETPPSIVDSESKIVITKPLPRYEGQFSKKISPYSNVRQTIENKKRETEVNKTEESTNEDTKHEEVTPVNEESIFEVKENEKRTPEKVKSEEIPFADDEENSANDLGKTAGEIRELRTVEREKARQQARERARLKSDEELGLEMRSRDQSEGRWRMKSSSSSSSSGKRSSKTSDSDSQKKSATWSGFGKKQRKGKSPPETGARNKERGFLSILTSFAKSNSRKSKEGKGKSVGEVPVPDSKAAAPKALEDSFSESDEDVLNQSEKSKVTSSSAKKEKEIAEEKLRKLQRIARKVYRRQEQKRLRQAQEIQRQLEEVEVKQRQLELRGVQVEKALRGEGEEGEKDEGELMQEWFTLVREKNALVRQEEELLVRAKELELEDRHSRLQQTLGDRMAIEDSKKTTKEIEEEGRILTEILEICEQRDALNKFLEEDRMSSSAIEDDDDDDKLPVNIDNAGSSGVKEC